MWKCYVNILKMIRTCSIGYTKSIHMNALRIRHIHTHTHTHTHARTHTHITNKINFKKPVTCQPLAGHTLFKSKETRNTFWHEMHILYKFNSYFWQTFLTYIAWWTWACMHITILCVKVKQKQVCEWSLYVEKI